MIECLAPFAALVAVLVAIPGPSVLLIIKSTILRGRRAAMFVAAGVLCGDLVWASAAIVGITALIVASRPAFELLRLVGAAYLVYLGLRLLLARSSHLDLARTADGGAVRSSHRSFAEGVLCELSNPKTLIVFTSVIPQFLSHHATASEVAVYGGLFACLGFVSLSIYVVSLGATRHVVRRRTRLPQLLLRGSGGLLTLFGIGLVVDRS